MKRARTVFVAAAVWSGLTACLFTLSFVSGRSVLHGAFQGWLLAHTGPFAILMYPYEFGYGVFWLVLLFALGFMALGLFLTGIWPKLFSVLGVSLWFLGGWAVIFAGY